MLQLPRVIAVCGFKRSGKDTVADWLVLNYGYKKLKIADPLKQMCKDLFNLSDDQVETDLKDETDEKWGVSPRQIMQFMGTEVMQYKIQELLPNVDRMFWMNKLVMDIDRCQTPVVISDVRFLHEYRALFDRYKDTFVIRIDNPSASSTSDAHVSENEWLNIPFHATLKNDGTLVDLHRKIDALMNESFQNT